MRILIAEDDPVSSRRLETILEKWGYEVVSCINGMQAWEILQEEKAPKLAILDWMMPGMDGLELCRKIRGRTNGPYIYIMMLTSKDDKDDIVKGMDTGVDDYITKPFYSHELKVRLRAGRRIIDLQTELIEARDAFELKATHDALTGIWNRGAIFDILKLEIERSKRDKRDLGVLMIDIDHFKHINDNYGHCVGDVVICDIVKRLTIKIRPYDGIGRFGGEEFIVVLPGCNNHVVSGIAERLLTAISEMPVGTNEEMIPVSISIGACVPENVGNINFESIIKAADDALYRAKDDGRNCFRMTDVTDV